MPGIEFAVEVATDFDRIIEHLARHESDAWSSRIRGIIKAIDVLQENPLIGRACGSGNRELIVGPDARRGYVVLYRYVVEVDTVFVLAVRSQREAGYARDPYT